MYIHKGLCFRDEDLICRVLLLQYTQYVHAEISVPRSYAERLCSKTCLVDLLIRSIIRSFSTEKSNELTDQQDLFCFEHKSAF